MNGKIFGICLLWLILIMWATSAFTVYSEADGLSVSGSISTFDSVDDDAGVTEQSAGLLKILWSAMTVQIEGLPGIFAVFYIIPTSIIGFFVVRFIVDLIPF